MRRRWRRAALLAGAPALILGVLSPAARADVGVSPRDAVQGDGVDLTFQVREDQPGAYTTKVELVLPEDAPVAEVYPLSVPDWAPKITYEQAHQHTQTQSGQAHVHGDGSTVTSSITWFRVTKPATTAAASELKVTMGPMPAVGRLAFGVIQTYSDGRIRFIDPGSGPVLTLRPATGADADSAAPQAVATSPASRSSAGSDGWPLALGLVAGATVGLLMALLALGRRRRPPTEEAPLDEPLEPVSGGPEPARATSDT